MTRKALGKGISAIIPEETRAAFAVETRPVPVAEIRPNPYQPRQQVEENLEELAASIKAKGVLQPVVVRRCRDGYELVMGERRLRAAKLAGLETIPAMVRDTDEAEMLELALIENLQRTDLNPVDEALAYRKLVDEFKLTHDEVAQRVGKDRSTVTNALRLLTLPYKVRDLLAAGRISTGHARALLSLSSRRDQVELAERIVRDGLSVRQVEKLCSRRAGLKEKPRPEKDVYIRELEERLQEALGTKVTVSESKRGGVIVVYYHSPEDLERLVNIMVRKE
ncbi:MAG: ParB/RepB/Spo0J family partition protein [candidate division WOR-3 bacterium]